MKGALHRGLFYAFIVWAPVPLGSNRPALWALNAIVVVVVFCLLVLEEIRDPHPEPVVRRIMTAILAAASLPLIWMLLQAARWTPAFLHAPDWDAVATGIGAISVNPGATLVAASGFVTVALSGVIAARIATSTRRAKMLLYAVLLSSGVVGAWGFLSMWLGLAQNISAGAGNPALTSFFVNRNTTATYLAIGLVVSVAFLTSRLATERSERLSSVIIDLPRRAGVPLLLVGFFAIALLATGSRAGVLAGFLGALAAFLLGSRIASSAARWTVGGAIVVLGAALLLLGDTSHLFFARLTDLDLAGEARWQLFRDTLVAIGDRPILGFGAGTFADFFPRYHSPALPSSGIWLEAHNTYLQLAAELGLPVFAACVGLLAGAAGLTMRAAWRGRDTMPASIAAAGAAIVIAIHSMFDFSLQIQSVAIAFAVLLGTGLAAPGRLASRRSRSASTERVDRGYESFNVIPESPAAQ